MTIILEKENESLVAFCRVILSCAVKPFCHLLIRTERSRGTETKRMEEEKEKQ